MSEATVYGFAAPGYEEIRQAFADNFTLRCDRGAAFAAYQDGKLVADLWGGVAAADRPWSHDSIQQIFSGTKVLVAGCMLKLVEQGRLELDAPVCEYWPEFAQGGKDKVRIRHVVSHTSGVPGVDISLAVDDISDPIAIESLIASQPLSRDPNAFNCYHPFTIGWLCGAILRRVDGRSLGRFFREEFAVPLALDIWIGLPPEHDSRVGVLTRAAGSVRWDELLTPQEALDPLRRSIWANPALFEEPIVWNERRIRAAEICGAGAIASARSMARYLQCLALGGEIDGVRVLRPDTVSLGRLQISSFTDPFVCEPMAFGVGLLLQTRLQVLGPDPEAFGHTGAGGSVHGAWPTTGTSFSYVMNEMRQDPSWSRTRPLIDALARAVRG